MGMPYAQVQSGTQPQGKGSPFNRTGGPSPSIKAMPMTSPPPSIGAMPMTSPPPSIGAMPMTSPPPSIGAMPPEDVMASIGATPPIDNNLKQDRFRPENILVRSAQAASSYDPNLRHNDGYDPAMVNMRPQVQAPPNTSVQMPRGKGGSTTNSATSGQPTFGQPNRYPNTVGQWDNASIQRTNQSPMAGGKGKG